MQLMVTSVMPLEKGRATVCFEDGSEITLYKGEIRKLGLTEGAVISEEDCRVTAEAALFY